MLQYNRCKTIPCAIYSQQSSPNRIHHIEVHKSYELWNPKGCKDKSQKSVLGALMREDNSASDIKLLKRSVAARNDDPLAGGDNIRTSHLYITCEERS